MREGRKGKKSIEKENCDIIFMERHNPTNIKHRKLQTNISIRNDAKFLTKVQQTEPSSTFNDKVS